jgi:hypothetical protein
VQKALAVFVRQLVAHRRVLQQVGATRFGAHRAEPFAVLRVAAKAGAALNHRDQFAYELGPGSRRR